MAIKTQGTLIKIETARAAAKACTGVTNASPGVAAVVGNGYTNGDIVAGDSFAGGMFQLNNRAFVVSAAATDSITLKAVDTTAYSTYSSGGNFYKLTMTAIGTVTAMPNVFDGTAPDINTTHLQSIAQEKLQGLPDFGNFSMDILLDNSDTGQATLRSAKEKQVAAGFSITLTDGKVAAFQAFVKSFSTAIAANEAVRATVQCSLAAAPAWYA